MNNKEIKVYRTDAREHKEIINTLSNIKPEIIIHLAAVSHANRSNSDPHSTFDNSVRTLENVLDYSRDKVEHFISHHQVWYMEILNQMRYQKIQIVIQ